MRLQLSAVCRQLWTLLNGLWRASCWHTQKQGHRSRKPSDCACSMYSLVVCRSSDFDNDQTCNIRRILNYEYMGSSNIAFAI
jgi:hypothetical protein